MPTPKLTLYVDVVSPFAYLAYYATRHSPIFRKCEITYIPISLGGLMKSCDNRPPGAIKNKDKWIDNERVRLAKLFNIPITPDMPANFPPQTIHVERVLAVLAAPGDLSADLSADLSSDLSSDPTSTSTSTSSSSPSPPLLAVALDALFHCFWVEGNADIGQAETFGPVLKTALGEQVADKALSEGRGEEAKKRLTENTRRAFDSGAFGLPWWECVNGKGESQAFWGFDRVDQVVRFLGLVVVVDDDDDGEDDMDVQRGLMESMKATSPRITTSML